jgi:hypothetical protein
MAVITKSTLKGNYPAVLTTGGATVAWANRSAGGDEFAFTGQEILLAWNNGSTGVATVTVTSVADGRNRTGDASVANIATGAMAAFGPFRSADGWVAADGNVDVVASGTGAADIDYAVLVLV